MCGTEPDPDRHSDKRLEERHPVHRCGGVGGIHRKTVVGVPEGVRAEAFENKAASKAKRPQKRSQRSGKVYIKRGEVAETGLAQW